MRQVLKWFAWMLAGLIGVLAALVALIVIANNTSVGQRMLSRIVTAISGGSVTTSGDPFWSPNHLHFDNLQLHDKQGTYLRLHDITIDWSILQLIHGRVAINKLTVGTATLERLPRWMSSGTSGKQKSSGLPATIVLHKLVVDKLVLAQAVAGKPYQFKLEGSGVLKSYSQGKGELTATQLGGTAVYRLTADINPKQLDLKISAHEPPHGLIASLANLPQLGGIAIDAKLNGPRDAVSADLTATVGKLRATANGTLDLEHDAADLTVAAQAPAMQPRPDLSWRSVALHARVQGPFDKPTVAGRLTIDQLAAYRGAARKLSANVSGNQGLVRVQAVADGLQIPGSHPDLLAGAPLTLDATAHLAEQGRPIDFLVRHPLLTAKGTARTAGTLQVRMHLVVPQLQPFAAVAGAKLQGHTELDVSGSEQNGTTHLAVNGTIGVEAGPPHTRSLVGTAAHVDTVVDLHGRDIRIERFALNGQDASASVHGRVAGGTVNLDWTGAITDLSALQPTLTGQVRAQGHVGGRAQDLSLMADVSGTVATRGMSSGRFTAQLQAQGLPDAPTGKMTAQGTLLGAPLTLAVAARKLPDGAYHVAIDRAGWKSAHAQGALTVNPPALLPQGRLSFAMTRLADLDPLLGEHLIGSAQATLDATASQARLTAQVHDASVPGTASVSRMNLKLNVATPTTQPVVDGTLVLDGFSARGMAGSATVRARGPEPALAVQLTATLPQLNGASAKLDAAGRVDVPGRAMTLNTLHADWKHVALRLERPVRISQLAGGVGVRGLRLAVDRGVLTANGSVGRTLDLTAELRDLPAGIATVIDPGLTATGTISGQARLTGSIGRPNGTVRLQARRLQLRSYPGRAMPPADLTASAALHNGTADLNARLGAGKSHLVVTGTAPVTGRGALNLRTTGAVDLAMFDPLLTAEGRRVTGRLAINARVTGTTARPQVAGTAQLADGEVQDYNYGVHLHAIAATIKAEGKDLHLTRFTARSGPGTVEGSGTIGLTAPMPVHLVFTAHNATPIANEIVTERLNAQLTMTGTMQGRLSVRGDVNVLHADVQIPEELPQQVAVIPVVNPNAPPKPAKRPGQAVTMALDLTIRAREVFVRGHGLDADLAGTVHVRGTSAHPLPTGGVKLRRGTFSVAGQTLTFTRGTIDFIGAGITDPALDFVATTTANSITATLTVGGTVQDPKITLSSSPELPQDEILAQMMFHSDVGSLSPFEVAQVAAAIGSLTGVTSGVDPLASLRKSLGLDRLSVGTNAAGNPTVRAGRYLAPGIYLGAKQNAAGAGTQAELQIDITKGLKLSTSAGTGSMSATGAESSGQQASVGVTYQFQY